MGVAGSGKSTIGRELAARLECSFVDGDDLHPPENVAKMSAGAPLTDADRAPWLDAVAAVLRSDAPVVVACSALRRNYRDTLRRAGDVRFLFLDIGHDAAVARLGEREAHFMGAGMAAGQFGTLERPGPDEDDIMTVDAESPVPALVEAAIAHLLETG